MNAAFDASILVYLLDKDASAPISDTTGLPVEFCQARVEYLLATLQRDKARIIIPTPALAEALVRAQDGAPELLKLLGSSRHFRVAPFDQKAAVEYAAVQADRLASGKRPSGAPWSKVKFDDQIVAIAAVESATVIYSDDAGIKKSAGSRFRVIGIEELPLPPENEEPMFEFAHIDHGSKEGTADED